MRAVRRTGGQTGRKRRDALCLLALTVFLPACPSARLPAQSPTPAASRLWRSDERTLVTDLSVVTGIAATRSVVYAATLGGLAMYDRAMLRWRETIGFAEGYPRSPVTTMVASPDDDTAWLAGPGFWARFENFGRRFDGGAIPGAPSEVVLDARNPSRGAFFRTGAGWYFVSRGGLAAMPASDVPPAGQRIASLNSQQLAARLPAYDAIRFRVERDDQAQRLHRLTAATVAPLTGEIFVGTDGNGSFKVDPVTYGVERLPAGLLGTAIGTVAAWRGQICAASEARIANPRRGLTCFDEDLGSFNYYETGPASALWAASVRSLLVTEQAVWAATDQGLLRMPRRGGRSQQLRIRDGLPSDYVAALAPAAGGVWVGTSSGLAFVTDTGRVAVVGARADGPAVLTLAATESDTLWAGTSAGLVAFLLPIGGPVVTFSEVGGLRDPIVALALRGDTVLAASSSRLMMRAGEWTTTSLAGHSVGQLLRIVPDESSGFWIAGSLGIGYFDPGRRVWNALTSPGDVLLPVRDIAATRHYAWVATDQGVLRFERRVLAP